MCDFKPGDEVVCVDADVSTSPLQGGSWETNLVLNATYTVRDVQLDPRCGHAVVMLSEAPNRGYGRDWGYMASRFRKVQRRDLTEWLSTAVKHTDHIDKRTKVPA